VLYEVIEIQVMQLKRMQDERGEDTVSDIEQSQWLRPTLLSINGIAKQVCVIPVSVIYL